MPPRGSKKGEKRGLVATTCSYCKAPLMRYKHRTYENRFCNAICRYSMPKEDLSGQTFERLTVLSYSHSHNSHRYYLCQCKCGTVKTVYGSALTSGGTKSCGCLQSEVRSAYARRVDNDLAAMLNRWEELKLLAEKSPSLNLILKELSTQYPVWGGLD